MGGMGGMIVCEWGRDAGDGLVYKGDEQQTRRWLVVSKAVTLVWFGVEEDGRALEGCVVLLH